MSKIPVIFLAFANDRVDDAAYLRNLPKELSSIREALEEASKSGLCEVVERANATINNILDVFQDSRYRDRIAIFHYGGHANGYQLLLENMDGGHSSAHSEGLVPFLAKQIGLQLVFLNGCSSQQQALDLVQAGLPSVIGTSQSINDDVATMLSTRFYQALGNGADLERAWFESVDQAKIQKGTANMRDLFWEGLETEAPLDQFPWEIYHREGEELVQHWNLPESADNPLFGLPLPNTKFDLPEQPYRFLERYSREHADIFFGRSRYIRDLYNNAIDPSAAPVLLFYGQSGVGKSSILDAGVFPRLEQHRQVVYIRRNETLGLLGTLREALGLGEQVRVDKKSEEKKERLRQEIAQLERMKLGKAEAVQEQFQILIDQLYHQLGSTQPLQIAKDSTLKKAWHDTEQSGNCPLIILLDQVEECFTRPNAIFKNELEEFLDEVKIVFQNKSERPQGKLILSYRKEYNPEIKEACIERSIPREEIFLKPLDRKGVIEVVKGLTMNNPLKRAYRLEVEGSLPVIVADDLLEDKDSPVAPVLQILLTKLWKMTEKEEERLFSTDHYQQLRRQGILMDDFFHEQMQQLEEAFPEEVASGLVLGLLQQHTTKLGTAGSRTLEQLRELYADRQEVIELLLNKCKDLYLLTSYNSQTLGLAHDTLAPLILQEFRKSDKPAQRGATIVDGKLLAFQRDQQNVIDPNDLRIVEEGIYGMPLFTRKEQILIDESRARAQAIKAEKVRIRQREIDDALRIKRNLRIAFGAAVLAVILALGAGYFYLNAEKAQQQAVNEAQHAKIAETKALKAEKTATQKAREAQISDSIAQIEKQHALTAQQEAVSEAAKVKAALFKVQATNLARFKKLHKNILERLNKSEYENALGEFRETVLLGSTGRNVQVALGKLAPALINHLGTASLPESFMWEVTQAMVAAGMENKAIDVFWAKAVDTPHLFRAAMLLELNRLKPIPLADRQWIVAKEIALYQYKEADSLLLASFIEVAGLRGMLAESDMKAYKPLKQLAALAKNPALASPLMVAIEAGTFALGCTDGDENCGEDETRQGAIDVPSFEIGRYEVTQAAYEAVMGENFSSFENCPACPMEYVEWYEAINYCNALSRLHGLDSFYVIISGATDSYDRPLVTIPDSTAMGYRLPFEEEWEYAARGGKYWKDGYIYSGSQDVEEVAWHEDNSNEQTHRVGSKAANQLGIYDMSGNVWEWCNNWYADYESYTDSQARKRLFKPEAGSFRVCRGGSWYGYGSYTRVSYRFNNKPQTQNDDLGFRIARFLP